MTASKGLKSNFSSLLAAQLWHRGCLLVSAILLAHTFGSQALGRLLSSISFVWMFWVLIDAGVGELFIRDVAARRELLVSYAGPLVRLKVVLAGIALGLMWLIASWYQPMQANVTLVGVLGLALVAESYGTLFRVLFRIQERMHLEAVLWILDGFLRLLVVLAVAHAGTLRDPMLWVGAGWLLTSLAGCFAAAYAVRRWWPVGTSALRLEAWPVLLRRSLPMALIYGLSFINLRGMILLLGLLRGNADAGYFGACERVLEALQILPISLAHALLPVSARLAVSAAGELRRMAWRVLSRVMGSAVLLSTLLVLFGGSLVRRVFGPDFSPSAQLMGLLGCALVPLFLKPVVEKMLCGLQRQQLVWQWYLAVAVCNVVAVLLVVPTRGLWGAAICLLVTEIASVGGLAIVLWSSLLALKPVSVPTASLAGELSDVLRPQEASV